MGNENKDSNYLDGLKAEFHKIVWPNKKLLGKQSVAVIFAAIVIGCAIAAIDWVMQIGLNFIVG